MHIWAAAALVALTACRRGATSGGNGVPEEAGPPDGGLASVTEVIAAADARDAKAAIFEAARTSRDPELRRRAAEGLSRIGGPAAEAGLSALLADEDPATVAWSAYGLGHACKGREDATVKQLAARAASLEGEDLGVTSPDPRLAIARAIGRCGGALAAETLRVWLDARGALRGPAALGLGDLLSRRKQVDPRLATSLLDALEPRSEGPEDAVFYALSRSEPDEALVPRVLAAAKAALGRKGASRILAVKTLGRVGPDRARTKEASAALQGIVTDKTSYDVGERAEAVRALGKLGVDGQAAAASALITLTPDRDAVAIAGFRGPEFHVLHALLEVLSTAPPKAAEPALQTLSRLTAPTTPEPALARRLAELRCQAALGLARGVSDAEVLRKCDDEGSEISQRARLASLLRRPIARERRAAFRAFARSEHLRVREQAISAIVDHPELGDAAAPLLAEALRSEHAGLVATAADVLHVHPQLALVLARSEIRAALDPKAPPPSAQPRQEISSDVESALSTALSHAWPEDRFETRIALIEAAAALHHARAKDLATSACSDPNPTVRERAAKALRTLGESPSACVPRSPAPAAEVAHLGTVPVRIALETDAGELRLVLDPSVSPVTVARIASLARSGFYDGIVVHRVVPGFVAQFGDPDGDGYGGSGTSLRCETSPIAFEALDIGMALAGRDTGSSQLFVTLARAPHLDGEYTRIGHAEGDWAALVQGDVVRHARVVE